MRCQSGALLSSEPSLSAEQPLLTGSGLPLTRTTCVNFHFVALSNSNNLVGGKKENKNHLGFLFYISRRLDWDASGFHMHHLEVA